MEFKEQVREILNDVEQGMSSCQKRSMATFIIAMLFYLGGLAALSLSHVIVAAAMFLFGLHFTMHYFRHLVIQETLQQTRAIVHLFESLSVELRGR